MNIFFSYIKSEFLFSSLHPLFFMLLLGISEKSSSILAFSLKAEQIQLSQHLLVCYTLQLLINLVALY